MSVQKIVFLSALSVACVSIAGLGSYQLFKTILTPSSPQNNPAASGSPLPQVVDAKSQCPLNGQEYTVDDQLRWEAQRPVAVMIENHPQSRPQSGLGTADIVYEAVAEGGITRFMPIFLCEPVPQWVGPVRSARTYFLDWLSEYNALYGHVGGANTPGPADALAQIQTYGIKSINEIPLDPRNSLRAGYQRITDPNNPVSLEHTMYLNLTMLRNYAQETFDWGVSTDGARWDSTFEKWQFADEVGAKIPSSASESTGISYEFWQGQGAGANVEWTYNPQTNGYLRKMNDQSHIDKNTQKQIEVKNIIVQIQEEQRANDGYPGNLHLLYTTTGTGDGYLLRDGKTIPIKWDKSSRTARTKFRDLSGNQLPLTRGKIWISTIPTYSKEYIEIKSVTAPPSPQNNN